MQNAKNLNTMKTKTIIFGVAIAIIATFTLSTSHAQTQEQPAVKVVPTNRQDQLKVIYAYNTNQSVEVRFLDSDRLVKKDIVKGKDFVGGFMKYYNVETMSGNAFWIEIESPELLVTYKMIPSKAGKWTAQLEKTTYTYPTVASR